MKEIIEWVVKTTDNIGASLGISGFLTRIIFLAIFVLLLTVIIVLCVRRSRKKKAKRKAKDPKLVAIAEEKQTEEIVEVTSTPKEEPKTQIKEVKKEEKEVPVPVKETKKTTLGKWIIELKSANEYVAVLQASNGEIMLTSETYTTADGARSGIDTIIKGIKADAFVIYQDKKDNYYYKLKTANNRLLCVGEIYTTKDQCVKATLTVKRIAEKSPVSSTVYEGAKYVEYSPLKLDPTTLNKGAKGKWKIEVTENKKFVVKLFASNGQLMLASEEVASKKTATTLVESIKKNAVDGNFIIDKDKFKRFYYKLRNAQKSVICIGESYDRVDTCISAIESVRRFCYTAPLENI